MWTTYLASTANYHRAAIPKDIADSYPKTEETFSLKTTDHREAVKRLRVAAAEVDHRFEEHRQRLAKSGQAALAELSDQTIKSLGELYYAYLFDEDEDLREVVPTNRTVV